MVGAAFGMADDHMGRTRVGQHRGRDVAGVRAGGGRVAILPAQRDGAASGASGHPGQQRRGRAEDDLDRRRGVGRDEAVDLGQAVARAVHLPVSCRKPAPHPILP
jgi:hypothetical protein